MIYEPKDVCALPQPAKLHDHANHSAIVTRIEEQREENGRASEVVRTSERLEARLCRLRWREVVCWQRR